MKPLSVNELASLDSILTQIQNHNTDKPKQFNQRIEWISLISALGVLAMELFGQGAISAMLRLTQFDPDLTYAMSAYMFTILGLIVTTSFLVMSSQANKENMSTASYLQRFKVMRVGSLLADLSLMALFLIALMSVGKGVWINSLLLVFTGHFLIKGYLFRFSEKWSFTIAVFAFAIGSVVFYWQVSSVLPALLFFLAINITSVVKSYR